MRHARKQPDITPAELQRWDFKMHLNRNLRAAVKAMSIEELATKYALITNTTTQGGGLLSPQDLHYELCLRIGMAGANEAVAKAREILAMVGDHEDFSSTSKNNVSF